MKIETPCYILDESKLERNYDNLVLSFNKYWNNLVVGYSYKTNSLPWLVNWFRSKGALAEVVSTTEYELAKYIGYSDNEIILNGPNKGFDTIYQLLLHGGIINLDSFHEIRWLKKNSYLFPDKCKVGLRVNIDLELYCSGETLMGSEPSRFGFNYENGDLMRAVDILTKIDNVEITGLHFHNSTKTKSLNIFRILASKAVAITRNYNLNLNYIDMGGGFYGDKPGAPTYVQYAEVIANELKQCFNPERTKLIIEPGISLAASCFNYICDVIDTKKRDKTSIVTTNGSLTSIDPQSNNRKFLVETISCNENKTKEKIVSNQVICGFTCMEKDRLIELINHKELKVKDRIVFENVGAYTMSLTPLFIEYFPNVYLETDGEYKVIREKWGVEEYIQKSKLK